jgi:toxin-antitoxin system PIN domain toxin
VKPFLPDTNLLIALFWPSHVHHAMAVTWFARNRSRGWATCPLTEAGFVRIVSNPGFSRDAVTPTEALAVLQENAKAGDHRFWAASLSVQDAVKTVRSRLAGHQQVTDAYLLGLAMRRHGVLATFDAGIAALFESPSGAATFLEVLSPA